MGRVKGTRPFFSSLAPKAYRAGTARTRAPAETLALLRPLMPRFGITRLANITGLDRLGIPVWQAVRPGSRSLSVSQGKGLDDVSAQASALMESLEGHHAERIRCPVRIESYSALRLEARVVEVGRMPLARAGSFHPHAPLPWAAARGLDDDEPVYVPFECIHTNYTLPRVPGSGAFVSSTSGLGSGNHPAEAVLHGVCELVERDAETLWQLRSEEQRSATRIATASIDHAIARTLLEKLSRSGMEAMIWDMTSDVGIASFTAIAFDPASDPLIDPSPAAGGSGCHPDRGIALCRALTEAAQSRLTAIAGSRDDLTLSGVVASQSATSLNHYRKLTEAPAPRRFEEVPHFAGETIDDDLEHVRGRLRESRLGPIVFVDLSDPELSLYFVRTLVPGLESSIESPSYWPRERALAVMT